MSSGGQSSSASLSLPAWGKSSEGAVLDRRGRTGGEGQEERDRRRGTGGEGQEERDSL